jgi:hypothetical protein
MREMKWTQVGFGSSSWTQLGEWSQSGGHPHPKSDSYGGTVMSSSMTTPMAAISMALPSILPLSLMAKAVREMFGNV